MMKINNDKEFAYRLYNMGIGDSTMHGGNSITRLPGGWMWGATFVPCNDEFRYLAHKPTDKKIQLKCPKCLGMSGHNIKEKFQGNEYKCDRAGCDRIITYNEKID